jgi:quercetin dioxygenase-like cupin family protein
MHRRSSLAALAACALTLVAARAGAQAPKPGNPGSVIEHDSTVAKEEPGTHGGGGMSTGYSFFGKVPGLTTAFRKRALHPGAGIGYHEQKEDEIYYVLSGKGEYTLDGVKHVVGPGDALLTRTGSSHGIKVLGDRDLVLIITYQVKPRPTP